jgi:hypothetical protein
MAKYGLKFMFLAIPSFIVWWLISFQTSPLASMDQPLDRFYFALNCVASAGFFCLLMGVEAVAHGRRLNLRVDFCAFCFLDFLSPKSFGPDLWVNRNVFNDGLAGIFGLPFYLCDLRSDHVENYPAVDPTASE